MTHNTQQKNKGFTLLFALLVSVLVLAVGASVISVALRQNVLSNIGRESQYAFYVANTGAECALYWDLNPPSGNSIERIFPVTSLGQTYDAANESNILCAGGNIVTGDEFDPEYDNGYTNNAWDQTGNTTRFRIALRDITSESENVPDHETYCAEVTVEKSIDVSTGDIVTQITSQGLNTCDVNSPRAVQRGLLIEYLQ